MAGREDCGTSENTGEGFITSNVFGGRREILTGYNRIATWDPNYEDGGCAWYDYCQSYCAPDNQCRHCGMDIAIPFGTDIRVAQAGRATISTDDDGWHTYRIWLTVRDGSEVHVYQHLSEFNGERDYEAGEVLGKSGCAESNHLHFERRIINSACGSGYLSADPTDLFEHAPIGTGSRTPVQSGFFPGDRISCRSASQVRPFPTITSTPSVTLSPRTHAYVINDRKFPMADGYEWVQIRTDGNAVRGWVQSNLWKKYHPNRIANADLTNNLVQVFALTPSTSVDRVQNIGADPSDWYAQAVCAGTTPNEGIRFASYDTLSLTGMRRGNASFVAKADRTITLDSVTIRLKYTDGTATEVSTRVKLTTTERFLVLKPFEIPVNKTIDKIELDLAQTTAAPVTIWADGLGVRVW